MRILKGILAAAGLMTVATASHAVMIDLKSLAEPGGGIGESAWTALMFQSNGTHTTNAASAFLSITGTNGSNSYAYLDANNAGLGVCGALNDPGNANQVTNSGTNLCNPSNDDNVTFHNNTDPETLHFVFSANVIIDRIWLNNNHDGDRSLLNDYVALGIDGVTSPTQLTNGGANLDSVLDLNLALGAGQSFDIGFDPTQSCLDASGSFSYNNCEFYISKIEFSTVSEPPLLALLGLGLAGLGMVARRRG